MLLESKKKVLTWSPGKLTVSAGIGESKVANWWESSYQNPGQANTYNNFDNVGYGKYGM
jgi:hypothetical protein